MSRRVLVHETVRRMINEVVTDLIENTRRNVAAAGPGSIEEVRARQKPLVGFSRTVAAEHQELKAFLRRSLYRHERVRGMNRRAQQVIKALFACYLNDIRAMPKEHADRARAWASERGEAGRARAVADYIAGMTDRYAVSAYKRLVDPNLEW